MSIQNKLKNNIFFMINSLTGRIAHLESQLMRMQRELDKQLAIQRNHLVRVKNNETLSDDFLQNGRVYFDLSPEKAWALFNDESQDFVFLDVSYKEYSPEGPRPKVTLHIPLEELAQRWTEIPNKTTPVLVISEDGLRSILACDFLATKEMFNCNNVSGGWKFWVGHRLVAVQSKATA